MTHPEKMFPSICVEILAVWDVASYCKNILCSECINGVSEVFNHCRAGGDNVWRFLQLLHCVLAKN
jgi:hypothetical protein